MIVFCFSEKCKARGFTVIVDGRKSQWNVVKTVVLMLQVMFSSVSREARFVSWQDIMMKIASALQCPTVPRLPSQQ